MLRNLGRACLCLAVAALAVGCGLGGRPAWSLPAAAVAAAWQFGPWRGREWPASAALVVHAGTAALGVAWGLGAGWMLLALTAALLAWDLDHFARLLDGAGHVIGAEQLQAGHLRRLLLVVAVGGSAGALALLLRLRLSLAGMLFLGLLVIVGLNRLVTYLRRAM